jgi:Ca2+-binding EF-hand superfamily protein
LFKSQTLVETTMPHGNADSRVSSLTEQEIEHARVVFHKIDANHNNSIDMFELKAAFERAFRDAKLVAVFFSMNLSSSSCIDIYQISARSCRTINYPS